MAVSVSVIEMNFGTRFFTSVITNLCSSEPTFWSCSLIIQSYCSLIVTSFSELAKKTNLNREKTASDSQSFARLRPILEL